MPAPWPPELLQHDGLHMTGRRRVGSVKHATHLFLEWASGWAWCGWPGWRVAPSRPGTSVRSQPVTASRSDEGVGLDLQLVIAELDRACAPVAPVARSAAAGERARRAARPTGPGRGSSPGLSSNWKLTCCPSSMAPGTAGWQVAVRGQQAGRSAARDGLLSAGWPWPCSGSRSLVAVVVPPLLAAVIGVMLLVMAAVILSCVVLSEDCG